MSAVAEQQETKLCSRCAHELPISSFRRKYKDRPRLVSPECNRCRNRLARLKTRKLHKRQLSKCLTQLEHAESIERVAGILDTMIRHFGGPEGFAKAWKQTLEDCGRSPRTAGFGAKSMMALVQMMQFVERHQAESRTTLETMTPEEFNQAADRMVLEMIAKNPAIAVKAACRLGWTVIPPEPQQG